MQRFPNSARERFLNLLGCVMNDIQHNFMDTIFAKMILQWRASVQELIHVDFEVGFLLEHFREIARSSSGGRYNLWLMLLMPVLRA